MSAHRTLLLPMILSLASLSACKSEAYESGSATGQTIQQAADEVDKGTASLDMTVSSLTALVDQPAPDPTPQFKSFSKALADLDTHAANVRDLSAEMEKNSAAYFAEWDKQIATISNEDIKSRSQERREKVEKALAKIREQYSEARDDFKPLLSDLKDIRTALASDLTPDGISSVKKLANKAAKRSEDVKESLTELSTEYRKLGIRLANAPTPAAAPKN